MPGFLIGIAEATFIIVIAVLWFGIPLRGNLLTLYIGVILFLLSAIGVGLMISSLSVTQQQGLLGAFLFLVPAIILSGFMVILRGVFLEGVPMRLLLDQLWPMAAIAIVTLSLAGVLFRRRMY